MNQPQCYTCHERPAEGYSAYCESCAPRDTYPLPPGMRIARCSFCGITFASTGLFDLHIRQGASGTIHRHPAQLLDGGHPLTLAKGRWTSTRPARVQNSPHGPEQDAGAELDAGGGQGVTAELRGAA